MAGVLPGYDSAIFVSPRFSSSASTAMCISAASLTAARVNLVYLLAENVVAHAGVMVGSLLGIFSALLAEAGAKQRREKNRVALC